jgi:hypothetical protein
MDTEIARKLRPSLRVSAARFTPISTFHEPARTVVQGAFDRAKKSLAEEFMGITTGGAPVEGLFPVMQTGVSVEPVVEAAHAFKDTLTKEQWLATNFDIDDRAWRSWHNMHIFLMRHGLLLKELEPAQRAAALRLIEASSSAAGYRSARDIMKLNHHAGEITDNMEEFGEWYYLD